MYRWGILATGNIAGAMAEALRLVPEVGLHAVASRDVARAEAFAARWQIPHAYGSYDALLADPAIDVVYIATPNAQHKDNILAALAAGKHVLCEKPLTTNPADTRECAAAAARAGRFLMEAMWTAFFPAMRKAQALVADGAIGAPVHLSAQFVSYRDPEDWPNLFDPDLGGGACLDLGVYPLSMARLLAGPIETICAKQVFAPSGVDVMTAMTARHENGVLSQLSVGFQCEMPITLRLSGTAGMVEIPHEFHHPDRVILHRGDRSETFALPPLGKGFAHEVMEVHDCLDHGRVESTIWPLSHSLATAALIAQVTQATP